MADKAPLQNNVGTSIEGKISAPSTYSRVVKYTAVRGITLLIALSLGLFLAVVLVNYGGFIDAIFEDRISWVILGMSMEMQDMPRDERERILEEAEAGMVEASGLNEPFLLRCVHWFWQAVKLDWGETRGVTALRGQPKHDVRRIILQRLPYTILLFGTATLILFASSISLALIMARKPGRWMDKFIVALTPISTAPSWIIAMVLMIILGASVTSFNFLHDVVSQGTFFSQIPELLGYMIVPVLAIVLSLFFQNLYTWRSYFRNQYDEDYVEMAKAQGLPGRTIDHRHIIRPTLPFILTSFSLMMITLWQGSIALEYFTSWPGIGSLLVQSIWRLERGIVMGIIVIFAYIIAITVFMLDIIYALVDPRVRIGGDGLSVKSVRNDRGILSRLWPRNWRSAPKRKVIAFDVQHTENPAGAEKKTIKERISGVPKSFARIRPAVRELMRYPSAVIGLVIIAVLILLSVYTMFAIPFDEAIRFWRPEQLENYQIPELAQPAWVNFFRREKLPATIILNSKQGTAEKETTVVSEDVSEVNLLFRFDYSSSDFPEDVTLYLTADYERKKPLVWITWVQPDGREIDFKELVITSSHTYRFDIEAREFPRKMRKGLSEPIHALFADPEQGQLTPIPGTYELRVRGMNFEEGADLNAELVVLGRVYGLAGSDNQKRDLTIPLLWGIPVALGLGFLGAVSASLITVIIAAVSAWYGGWVDNLVQRITEVNMILPTLALAITIFYIYSKSVWVIIGIFVLLSIFSTSVKNYRAVFLQTKEASYIEAARAYGASNWRIITRYLIPSIIPVLVPQLIILTPTFVFLEATLAYLGVSDPSFP
ncbi:MAG: ABC transporter permease subunit, partial [Chloroflexota bacterium]|nr:ABC transporter permease subunit [Chloroflexota bacterium]